MNVRSMVGEARSLARYSKFWDNSSDAVRVAYIGWTGEDNIGDDAMYWCQKSLLGPGVSLIPVPLVGENFVLRRLAGKKIDAVCLGGGTLIGNGHFGRTLNALQDLKPDVPYFMLGVGCESHRYVEGRRRGVERELDVWSRLLSSFETVRVRGPQSRDTLQAFGVDASISGDPALMLPRWGGVAERRVVGLNIGITEDSHGNAASDPLRLMREMASSIRGAGYTVMLLPTTLDDYELSRKFMSTSPHDVVAYPRMLDFHEYAVAVSRCGFVVGMKLHSLIIAASQGVLPIALEYRPKCSDFMQSIGFGERTMRLDAIDRVELQTWFEEYEDRRRYLTEKLEAAVAGQQNSLRLAAQSANEILSVKQAASV